MFNQYPYLNINDLNLDFILNAIREMKYEVTNFVSINAIKYADPIQWNITSQYEKNTIVIDPVTGTAYISVAPVPSGVSLTRPEYWTVVFDLGSFVTRAAQNFTSRWESETTTTATFASSTGDWLVWGDVLYKALSNIIAGDTYVVGSNIEHFTIEDLYNAYLNTIANVLAMIGNLDDLATTDKTNIVNAINEVLSKTFSKVFHADTVNDMLDLNCADGDVVFTAGFYTARDGGAAHYKISSAGTADNIFVFAMTNGTFANLVTNGDPINVLTLGMKNDGSADISTIFNAANTHAMRFPVGSYRVDNTLQVNASIFGSGKQGQWLTPDNYGTVFTSNITGDNTTAVLKVVGYDVTIDGILIDCHSEEVGLWIAGNNCHTLRDIFIFNCKSYGLYSTQAGSRPLIIENVGVDMSYGRVWESYYAATIGFYFERGTDIMMNNCHIMGFCRGLECNGYVMMENCHLWGGGDTSSGQDWTNWNGSMGLRVNAGAQITAHDLYLDAFATPIYNVGGSTVDISDVYMYSDDAIYSQTGVTKLHHLNVSRKGLHINGGYIYAPAYMANMVENITDMTGVKISFNNQDTDYTGAYYGAALPYLSYSDKKTISMSRTGLTSGHYYEFARLPYFQARAQVFDFTYESNRVHITYINAGTPVVTFAHLDGNIPIYYKIVGQFVVFYVQISSTSMLWSLTEVSAPRIGLVDYTNLFTAGRNPFNGFLTQSDASGLTVVDAPRYYQPITSAVGTVSNDFAIHNNGVCQLFATITLTADVAAFGTIATLKSWARPLVSYSHIVDGVRYFIDAATGNISCNSSLTTGTVVVISELYLQ